MTKEEAIKYLQQLYPNGGHCWLDEQRTEAIGMAVKALQDEPVSIWHDSSKETPTTGSNILMIRKEEKDSNYPPIAGCFHGESYPYNKLHWGYYNGFCYNEIEPPVKWAYIDDILNLSNVQRNLNEWKEPVSEDLEKAIDTYLATYWGGEKEKQEWPFLKKMAIHFAEWQRQKDSELPKIWPRDTIDEYAYQIAYDLSNDWKKETATWDDVEKACKLGAQWKMAQMIKDAVVMEAHEEYGELWGDITKFSTEKGKKYKVIILKMEGLL